MLKIISSTNNNYTPLMLAAQNGDKDAVKLYIQLGANIDIVASDNETALTIAAKAGHDEVVELLLSSGADITINNTDFTCS